MTPLPTVWAMIRNAIPAAACALAQATFDALLGARALHQVRPHLSPQAFAQLVAYWDAPRFKVRSAGRLWLKSPTAGSVEACGTLQVQTRWLACAIRLDRDLRWLCSDLRVVGFPA